MKTAGKIRNAATRLVSKGFSDEYIRDKALNGEHNGESMQQIYQKIMMDPSVHRVEREESGVYDLILEKDGKETNIGWLDANRGVGEISQKGYDQVQDVPVDALPYDDFDGRFLEDYDPTEPEYDEDIPLDAFSDRELPDDVIESEFDDTDDLDF